ncbi:MAG TPA: thiamine diphosphokinase [Candidatus Poseidoniales archaeon]|jgi:thiamine pyrophosphokinase|nr:MAG TPA: thiamine diphosphokinase [Candidatus Poseidoniales archaeon]|tara:strand:- start:15617 stop:16225 length:609 start_codon:yes stop_codon:yes gene_type:complete
MMRAVLWCNGETPTEELVTPLLEDTVLYGVDGGAAKAVAAGYEVSEVLGDLDSVDPSEWDGKSTHLSDDSSSDLAKSLGLLQKRGFTEVDVVGIDGGCPDHILGTWAALAEAPAGLDIRLHHAGGITIRAHPEDGALDILIPKGDEFSIFALEECQTVTIKGARWELNAEPLSFSTRGLHNESLGEPISVSADGILAVIIHT